ncbi:hypothetical protein ACPF8X_31010, partial [Streptomyces sp. G35A]
PTALGGQATTPLASAGSTPHPPRPSADPTALLDTSATASPQRTSRAPDPTTPGPPAPARTPPPREPAPDHPGAPDPDSDPGLCVPIIGVCVGGLDLPGAKP